MLTNNRITGNTAFGKGGGIAMYNEVNATIVNNLITGNTAGSSGGGVHFLVPYGDRGPWLINNTIADNPSTLGPGVFADGYNGQSVLINNIVTAASGAPVYCGSPNTTTYPVFEYNDVFSPSGADYGGLCPSQSNQNGNISADPLFTGPASGVYTVRPNSPVIDAGTRDRAPTTDLAGAARPLDGNSDGTAQFDMGAMKRRPRRRPRRSCRVSRLRSRV